VTTIYEAPTWIEISGGARFDVCRPDCDNIELRDIATSLAKQSRFLGRGLLHRHLSIAEHCLIVAAMVPAWCKLEALLHDASEAYCADIPSPHKQLYPDYVAIEDRVRAAICGKYGLMPVCGPVHTADRSACVIEARAIGMHPETWPGDWATIATPADVRVRFLQPLDAYEAWLYAVQTEIEDRAAKRRAMEGKR
jgi:5'-deoxynucleotidase YfbR-like HD superfamily hydrolase